MGFAFKVFNQIYANTVSLYCATYRAVQFLLDIKQ